ncbi:methyl-accepting chemotaxis protein [Oceanispirochaeta crateris]|uniref:Methyl-accepting chemotaxis protein n=1 Tax=Oceanispirochaeta crateris TaxID=2518645 RepID=A0A5C1QKY4_9SPIO|nr:HAMP domain-containing methyl-accepting chemotaxis protein [Oceanispirochaeta crateris]QEN08261.1 methyl-accepting chemotaxis protein [Oceanispirochaeta crateris]
MNSFFSIKFRLYLLMAVFITNSLIIGILVNSYLGIINRHWNHYNAAVVDTEVYFAQLESALGYGGMIHHFKNYILRQDAEYIEKGNISFESFNLSLDKIYSSPELTSEEKTHLEIIKNTMTEYRNALLSAKNLYDQGKTVSETDSIILIDDAPALAAFTWFKENIKQNKEFFHDELSITINKAIYQTVIILIITMIFFLIFAFWILSSITKPLLSIQQITDTVAKGNLSKKIDMNKKNEIGSIANNFDAAITSLRTLVKSVKISSNGSQEISENLNSQMVQTASAVSEISANIESMERQFEKLTDSIGTSSSSLEQIVSNIESLAAEITDQSSAVSQSSASVEQINASIKNVACIAEMKIQAAGNLVVIASAGEEEVSSTNSLITDTSKSVDDILEMINIINDIASQTNLLSMNAAIEAAHAGDAGKGFAVVADEIRKLAENTAENSKRISKTLTHMVNNINETLSLSNKSGLTLANINDEVREVISAFEEIARSTVELSSGSNEILSSSNHLNEITESIRLESQEMNIGAKEINKELKLIKEISKNSLSGIKEIRYGSNEINQSVNFIQEISKENTENISKLIQQISIFTT